jgi:predicted ATP-grasp superfamily ATP-dependent carboligase
VTILVAAISGRALATAAHRVGERVIVADFFGDLDTRQIADWVPLPGSLQNGVDADGLCALVAEWRRPLDGIVFGAGFEADPALLHEIGRLAPILGNTPATIARVKDEREFARLLERLHLSHPALSEEPHHDDVWLRKRRGGSGGAHVTPAPGSPPPGRGAHYYQAFAPGRPVSALFVADGVSSHILGLSAQWSSPGDGAPFRYGGCAGPLQVPAETTARIEEACRAIAAATGLVGLNSLDMLLDGEALTILEVNPRPGATLDIFDAAEQERSLWRLHLDGVAGRLPDSSLLLERPYALAASIVYAPAKMRVPGTFLWPDWAADLPAPHTEFAAGAPVCTVFAEAEDIDAARDLTDRRGAKILCGLVSRAASAA